MIKFPDVPNHLQPFFWALAEFFKEIKEYPGLTHNNPRIIFYHSFTTLQATEDEVPWCSSFVCASAVSTGFNSTRSAAAKSWLTYGTKSVGRIGDLAVFKRTGGHHVGFVYDPIDTNSQFIRILGGNQSNRVCISSYSKNDLLDFRQFI